MIETIIRLSVRNKLVVGLLVLGLILLGVYNLRMLPIDAVPDITNNQVQVVTVSPSLAPQEVEQFITYPVEVAVANIPKVTEVRSISRFGLSVVTIVFEDIVPILEARQFVKEQISMAQEEIPPGLGSPELMPITTGLGEIYQYILDVKPGYEHQFDPMELRTIQDWIVKRQLAGTPGIIEISSFGGYLKQYEVAIDPGMLQSLDISLGEVFDALARNNQNSGGSYIEKANNALYIRTEGLVKSIEDIERIPIGIKKGLPILVRDVGTVRFGSPKRFGAMTMDGKGEAVGGITLMLKGANSSEAIANVHKRIEQVQKSLPEGVVLYPYLDRSVLVGKTISTVKKNLLEGGIIVVFILVLLLGDLRAGFIVASVIPLAMLFAIILMRYFNVSANLMSLGAIDFGIVVDGAVIVVEGVLHALFTFYVGKHLTQREMDDMIIDSSSKLFRAAVFGVFIILVVFIPIMTLTGIEGKMFRPMALTFSFAVLGALLLSLTYVPAISALILPKKVKAHQSFADKLVGVLRKLYRPALEWSLDRPVLPITLAVGMLVAAFLVFRTMGSVFIPTLEEGDLAMQMTIQPGSSLQESIASSTRAERILLDNFPEVKHVVSKIGTAEVPTDPMAIEDADIMIVLKEKEEWVSATNREVLVEKMKEKLEMVPGASFEFTQPIQLRFNELMTGAKTDIAVKIFGENTEVLKQYGDRAAALMEGIPGASDIKVDQTDGLPQLLIEYNRDKIAQYGISIEEINSLVRTAFAGESAGVVFENERKFDLVVRLDENSRKELNLSKLFVHLPGQEGSIPLSEVAAVNYKEGPMQISREDAKRRINIGVNVRNRDIASLVAEIQTKLDAELDLPPGYTVQYGGQFENLEKARKRLSLAVPVALLLIFALLYFTFEKVKYAIMIFSAVPLSAIGGVFALWIRDMPFSISAGVGFIALFGVAVLNGIVLISHFNRMRYDDGESDMRKVVIEGGLVRLRPVVMTALVAALGFLPMALSNTNGAEVQKPLATVVIGGLITATLLTLILLPVFYYLVNRSIKRPHVVKFGVWFIPFLLVTGINAQDARVLTLDEAESMALTNNPLVQNADLGVQQARAGLKGVRELPPLQSDLQVGQINTNLLDYNFSISQGIGQPAVDKQKRLLMNTELAYAEKTGMQVKEEILFEVRKTWYEWCYRWEQVRILEQQEQVYKNVYERANRQYELGAIDRLEQTLAEGKLTQAQRKVLEARRQLAKVFQMLLQQTFLDGTFVPPSDTLVEIAIPKELEAGDLFTAPLALDIDRARFQTAMEKARLKPSFSAGYFLQSIRPDYTFQGVIAGMSVPIFKKSHQSAIERSQLQEQIAANKYSYRVYQVEMARFRQDEQLQRHREELDGYGKVLKEQAQALRRLSNEKQSKGEMDYFQVAQSLELAFQNELDYLDILHQYNMEALHWNFLRK